MNIEWIVFGIAAVVVYCIWNDVSFSYMAVAYKKHYQTLGILIAAGFICILFRRTPAKICQLCVSIGQFIRYLPVKQTSAQPSRPPQLPLHLPPQPPLPQMGGHPDTTKARVKRVVSETKKKYVASQQGWTCDGCKQQLTHTFEVDHIQSLDAGGTNDVSNLVALCRECHGQKTAMRYM